ncbi:hypothetical protein ACNUDM_20605 [Vibrio chaetopteri]|uniref:hypothetical protein n=1 Tax=Vibrio chaetopteri TaxID=3016528 RepID=UPI003AB40665
METSNKLMLATLFSHTIAVGAFAAVPNTFSAGSPALASEVNENFSQLDSRLTALEGSESDSYITVEVDCSENAKALVEAFEGSRNSNAQMEYLISGSCEGAEIARADVRIDGSGSASITEGEDMDGESLFIDAQSNVRLSNLTLEGTLFVRNNSNLRLEDVTLPTPVISGDEYDPNIYIRTSYLRINSGSIDNLSLLLNRNASADIRSAVIGNAFQVVADGNSTLVIQSDTATYDTVEAIGSSFVHSQGSVLVADDLYASRGSSIEANSLQVTDFVDIWGNSHLYVQGDVTVGTEGNGRFNVFQNSAAQVSGNLSAGEMECSNSSSFDVDGDLETRGSLDWAGDAGLAVQRGCFGRYGESDSNSLIGGYVIDHHSEVYTPSWAALSESNDEEPQ